MANTKKDSAEESIWGWIWTVADQLMCRQDLKQDLTTLRDTLLPKLMNEEVRVEYAETLLTNIDHE